MNMKKVFITFTILILFCIGIILTSCNKENTLTIGHKNYTESRILGQMFALIIENNTDFKTDVKEFGGSALALEALKNDNIVSYPEYTGTIYGSYLNQSEFKDPTKVYDYISEVFAKEYSINLLKPLGFNNTYTLALKEEKAQELNIETFSDLVEYAPDLKLGSTMEFIERKDGLVGLKEIYGYEFKDIITLDPGLRYTAMEDDKIEVMDAFSTDGQIKVLGLKILEDDKNFFPPYYCIPLIKSDFAEEHPEVAEALNKLGNKIDEEAMQEMNYLVDEKNLPEKKVAEDFLKENNLID